MAQALEGHANSYASLSRIIAVSPWILNKWLPSTVYLSRYMEVSPGNLQATDSWPSDQKHVFAAFQNCCQDGELLRILPKLFPPTLFTKLMFH